MLDQFKRFRDFDCRDASRATWLCSLDHCLPRRDLFPFLAVRSGRDSWACAGRHLDKRFLIKIWVASARLQFVHQLLWNLGCLGRRLITAWEAGQYHAISMTCYKTLTIGPQYHKRVSNGMRNAASVDGLFGVGSLSTCNHRRRHQQIRPQRRST